jgi:putative phosphoribosyl transferase
MRPDTPKFADRTDAGFEIGRLLEKEFKDKNVLVLGIPRGGIVVAYEVAKMLNGELSTVITKKLPHPAHKEYAIGAVAEDGSVFLTSSGRSLGKETIEHIIKVQSQEIRSRIQRFRKGEPLPQMHDRIVILVDDGIATGSTIVPAIKLCRQRKAAQIVVASPVADGYVPEIDSLADKVVIADRPEPFHAVGQAYEDFHDLADHEVIGLLEDFNRNYLPQQH